MAGNVAGHLCLYVVVLGSDHNPIIVQGESRCGKGKKLFRFESYWANEVECQDIVRRCWEMPCLMIICLDRLNG